MSVPIINRVTVPVGHSALVYRSGILQRVLSPGAHWVIGTATMVEMRERLIALAPQEVLTSDAVSLRVTVALRFAVTDAAAFIETAADPVSAVYLAAQIALRTIVSGVTADDVMQRSDRLDAGVVLTAAQAAGARVGVDVREVFIKDVLVPAEIRSAALELVTAKARGAAQLETARAETAALRALANAGRLLDTHPALAQLRLVQSMPYGSRVVLTSGGAGTESGVTPVDDHQG